MPNICFCSESYTLDGYCAACGKKQKQDCQHIVGYMEQDEHERTHLVYNPKHYNEKYFIPFEFCPMCGDKLRKA